MRNIRRVAAIGWIALLGAPAPFRAENLLPNGDFDDDVLTWFDGGNGADLVWDALDHDSCGSASGSALATNSNVNGGETTYVACVLGIVAGAPYSVDGFLRIPTGQTATGGVTIRVYWYDSEATCDGDGIDIDETSELPTSNPGVWIHKTLRDLVAPAGAKSALVGPMVSKEAGAPALEARFDGIHMVAGNGYLFGEGFESDSTCRWEVAP